jgi:hypothetical protein
MQMQEMSSIDRRMRAGLHATMTHE